MNKVKWVCKCQNESNITATEEHEPWTGMVYKYMQLKWYTKYHCSKCGEEHIVDHPRSNNTRDVLAF